MEWMDEGMSDGTKSEEMREKREKKGKKIKREE